ncbi:MAG: aminopeptidase P family protein [Chlamydiia bacterium]|nr:aminopeptidase P family protein [Chlamydiia bacterium]
MKVDGFVLENPTDLFYFTGLQFSRGRLLITKTKTVLFVDGRYKEAAEKGSPFSVKPLEKKALEETLVAGSGKVFGFDHGLSVGAYKELKGVFAKKKKTLKGCDHPTLNVRAIKEKHELEKIKKSAALLWKGFLYVKKQLKVGISEIELARKFEFYVKNYGAEALSFEPIVAFGSNSALPHHHSSARKLKKGELVLIDIGVVVEGYASDMTRTLFFGKISKRLEALYKTVVASQEAALKQCKAGVHVAELDRVARKAMGKDVKHFLHSLGHGIGLDVHEYPSISSKEKKATLESGMVVTIEPGLYLSGVGGIRHEDMVIITKTGHINLFK